VIHRKFLVSKKYRFLILVPAIFIPSSGKFWFRLELHFAVPVHPYNAQSSLISSGVGEMEKLYGDPHSTVATTLKD